MNSHFYQREHTEQGHISPVPSASVTLVLTHADISHANLRGGVSLSVLVERQSPWATFILFLHNSEAETVRSIEEITASEARNAAA